MSERIKSTASKVGYSMMAFVSTFAVLWPASRAVAQEAVTIPVPDMLVDFAQATPLALLVSMVVELLRVGIPWLSRKHLAGPNAYNPQKNALRLISVLLGALAGALGSASPMGDGSDPRQLGGIASGCIAALFGGQLMPLFQQFLGAVADRIKALRSKR